jgi:hypothetical protein
VALKKPSEYFKKDVPSVDNSIREDIKSPELNTFSAAFELFKKNLTKIDSLSDFSETIDNYRVNIERVNYLSERIDDIQTDIKNLLKKEDLDRAMLSQLFVVEQTTNDVQTKVKSINEKTLREIRSNVSDLTQNINEFLEVEVPRYKKQITNNEVRFNNELKEHKEEIDDRIKEFYSVLNEFNDVVQVIETVSSIENYIQEHHQELNTLKNEVFNEIGQLPIGNIQENIERLEKKIDLIKETYSQIDPESVAKEIIQEGLLNEPPEVKNEDPLTPLNQKFVTLEQLQEHYRLFLNRIQQQLSTFGGGGETRLKYLDDVVGIATNPSAYDGKFLKYDHSIGKFEFVTVSGGGGGGTQTLDDTLQLGNTSSLGINIGVTTVTSLNVDSVANLDTNSITFGSTSSTEIYSFPASQYRSARVQVQISQGTDYQTSDLLLIHNGSTSSLIEYASISTNDYLGTFESIISGGNVSLRILMASASSSTVKVASQAITL